MTYDHILIRYGELGLKGKNKHQFIDRLQGNMQRRLASFKNVQVKRSSGRMFVQLNGHEAEPVINALQRVFGIYSMSVAMKVANDESAIKAGVLHALEQTAKGRTFKVNVRRANKQFP